MHRWQRVGSHAFVDSAGVACAAAIALLVAGCSMRYGGAAPTTEPPPATSTGDAGQIANLRSIGGSALTGRIRVIDRGDNGTILASLINVPVGAYRIILHETPNCTSPNAFSAGAPWAPPASGTRPLDLIPTQYANSEAIVEAELRIAGLHANGANGVAGHSVVVYAGSSVTEIRPDVPNAAIACGVFAPVQPLAF
jgi:Cu/Zn superoxide dismutase